MKKSKKKSDCICLGTRAITTIQDCPICTDTKDEITTCVWTSKGEMKRIQIMNPDLFDQVARSLGYIKDKNQ